MGLIRKAASVSTLGAVGFHSRREAQAKAALARAKLAKEERKAVKHERTTEDADRRDAEAEQRERAAQGRPWWRQPAVGDAIRATGHKRTAATVWTAPSCSISRWFSRAYVTYHPTRLLPEPTVCAHAALSKIIPCISRVSIPPVCETAVIGK